MDVSKLAQHAAEEDHKLNEHKLIFYRLSLSYIQEILIAHKLYSDNSKPTNPTHLVSLDREGIKT